MAERPQGSHPLAGGHRALPEDHRRSARNHPPHVRDRRGHRPTWWLARCFRRHQRGRRMTDPNHLQLWSDFLQAWPPERVRAMTLAEYTNPDRDDAFIYWLESRLGELGSI